MIQACNPPDTFWLIGRLFRSRGVRFVFDHHDLCPEIFRSRFGRDRGLAIEPAAGARAGDLRRRRPRDQHERVVPVGGDPPRPQALRATPRWCGPGPIPRVMRAGEPGSSSVRRAASTCAATSGSWATRTASTSSSGPPTCSSTAGAGPTSQFALLGFGDTLERSPGADHRARALTTYVTFTGRADLDGDHRYLSTATVGLSPDPMTPFNDASTMNKTLEYMAFGLPVVAFDLTETRVSAGPAASLRGG